MKSLLGSVRFRRGVVTAGLVLGCLLAASSPHLAADSAPQVQPGQEEFLPIDELPPEDQLPAAPLLVAAYAFVWVALLLYFWSIWRRLAGVERDLAEVARRVRERDRSASWEA